MHALSYSPTATNMHVMDVDNQNLNIWPAASPGLCAAAFNVFRVDCELQAAALCPSSMLLRLSISKCVLTTLAVHCDEMTAWERLHAAAAAVSNTMCRGKGSCGHEVLIVFVTLVLLLLGKSQTTTVSVISCWYIFDSERRLRSERNRPCTDTSAASRPVVPSSVLLDALAAEYRTNTTSNTTDQVSGSANSGEQSYICSWTTSPAWPRVTVQ